MRNGGIFFVLFCVAGQGVEMVPDLLKAILVRLFSFVGLKAFCVRGVSTGHVDSGTPVPQWVHTRQPWPESRMPD